MWSGPPNNNILFLKGTAVKHSNTKYLMQNIQKLGPMLNQSHSSAETCGVGALC